MNAIDNLREMNHMAMLDKLKLPDEEFEEWLESIGLLHAFQECDLCGEQMKIFQANANWICHKVIRRSATVLLPIIRRHIRPGSTLMSDMWRAYGGINAMPQRYHHWTINHTYNFVDPNDRRKHTQTIESKWQKWRANVRRKYGIHDKQYQEHLWEFNWRERFGKRTEVFFNFWSQVAALYPCNR
jgi:transposase-like protein